MLWVDLETNERASLDVKRGWIDDGVDRQQEALGVEVRETELSPALASKSPTWSRMLKQRKVGGWLFRVPDIGTLAMP